MDILMLHNLNIFVTSDKAKKINAPKLYIIILSLAICGRYSVGTQHILFGRMIVNMRVNITEILWTKMIIVSDTEVTLVLKVLTNDK